MRIFGLAGRLSLHVDLGERHYRAPCRRMPHQGRRTERRENKHVLHLHRQILIFAGIRENTVVVYTPLGIHVSFNHQRIFLDAVRRSPKRRLFKLGRGLNHQRNVAIAGLERRRQKRHQHAEEHQASPPIQRWRAP